MNKNIIIVIELIIIALLGGGFFWYSNKLNNNNNNNNVIDNLDNEEDTIEQDNNDKEETNELSTKDIEKYLSYVPIFPEQIYIEDEQGKVDAYAKDKVLVSDISINLLAYTTYNNIKTSENISTIICSGKSSCDPEYYASIKDFNDNFKKMYNMDNKTISVIYGPGSEVKKDNNYFVETYGRGYTKIQKVNTIKDVNKTDNELTITEDVSFIIFAAPSDFYVYNSTKNINNENNSYSVNDIICNDEDNCVMPTNKEIFSDKNNYKTYKHTFKLNENNDYYWYSTEVI